jgi:protein-disulfide isomerase
MNMRSLWSRIAKMTGRRIGENPRPVPLRGARFRAWSAGRIRAALPALLTFLVASAGLAEDRAALAENGARNSGVTGKQADDMLNELRGIRQLLERLTKPGTPEPSAPRTGKLKLDGGFSLGSSDAPVTMVEFTDYQCSFCRRFHSATLAEIRGKYIDTGKVRLVVRDFPLDMHADAMQAAEAAHCAGDQGKFWAMHDALFSGPGKLGHTDLIDYAEALKLDVGTFRSCLESGKHKPEIQNDMQAASSLQIGGTPAFLIGKTTGGEVTGAIVIGAQPFGVFEAKFKEAGALP